LVTLTLIGLCVIVAVVGAGLPQGRLTIDFALWPALVGEQPWRLLTATFLHSGIFHLAVNMYSLWVLGSFLEQVLGRWRFAALYLASGLGGSLAVMASAEFLNADGQEWITPTVGASGAIFGLFGAIVWVVKRLGQAMGGIIGLLAVNVILSFSIQGISWQGHMGGLAVGLGLGAVYAFAPRGKAKQYGVAATAGVFVLLAIAYVGLRANLPIWLG
jgi:membrane associated rhomboid family serine protease